MSEQLSMESLAAKIDNIAKVASTLEAKMAASIAAADKDDDKEKEKSKMEAAMKSKRARRDMAMKKAMDMTDDKKRDAAMRQAMRDYDDDDDKKGARGASDKDKDDDDDDKDERANKGARTAALERLMQQTRVKTASCILEAIKVLRPADYTASIQRVKQASTEELAREWDIIEPYVRSMGISLEGTPAAQHPTQKPVQAFPPFQASYDLAGEDSYTPETPDVNFDKLSTAALLGGKI